MNRERKELYYRSKKITNTAKSILEKMQQYEDDIQQDVCQWEKGTVLNFLKSLDYVFPLEIYIAHQALMSFVDYCAIKGDSCSDGVSRIGIDDLVDCLDADEIKKYYLRRPEFIPKVMIMNNPVDRFFILGLYEGIQTNNGKAEMIETKLSDVDADGNLHLCSGRVIPISEELRAIMVESEKTYEYIGTRGTRLMASPDYVVKPTYRRNSSISDRAFARRVERVVESFELKNNLNLLTPFKINEIGRFDYISRLVEEGKYTLDQLFSWAKDGKANVHEDIYGPVSRRGLIKSFYERAMQI